MKRERHDATVISSSIALLQERFRELQRVKAIREEQEVTWRILALSDSQPKDNLMMMNSKRARLLFHPDHHVPGPSASLGVSLSSCPALKKRKLEEEDYVYGTSVKAPLLINLWPVSGAETSSLDTTTSSSNKFEDFHYCDADVDTSLHL